MATPPYRELHYVEIKREVEASMHHWNFSNSQSVRQSLQLSTHPVIYQSYRRELTCGINDAWLSFGRPNSANGRRLNDCLVLEPSEMIVVDQRLYSDRNSSRLSSTSAAARMRSQVEPTSLAHRRRSNSATNMERGLHLDIVSHSSNPLRSPPVELPVGEHGQHSAHSTAPFAVMRSHSTASGDQHSYKRSSRNSDTSSSFCSGEGDGPSQHDSSLIDSDDDGEYGTESAITDVDTARECLEKNPDERNEDDIEILLEFLQNLPAFANMTMAIRRALCAVMVYAVVEKAGTVVMNDGEELDSWSVILNGQVQITYEDESNTCLSMGDSFGIKPSKEKEYHRGVMTTTVDDCQFVCIAQDNYYEILSAGEENTTKFEENGVVVLVTENRALENGARHGDIVISGTPDRLVRHLIEDRSSIDMTYDEDFLLTYRLFLKTPMEIADRLLKWFEDDSLRERITRVVLLWVNNHFNDFESDMEMTEFLQNFELALEDHAMLAHLRFLHIACAAKARPRSVTLTRAKRDEILYFSILGGVDQNCGIFISNVEKGSKAYHAGLKRGDQILEVNGSNFESISHSKALEVLRGTTLLSITVKSNLLAFRDMLNKSDKSEGGAFAVRTAKTLIKITNKVHDESDSVDGGYQPIIGKKSKGGSSNKTKLLKMLARMSLLPKTNMVRTTRDSTDLGSSEPRPRSNSLNDDCSTLTRSNSSPDVTQLSAYSIDNNLDIPEHVLKVYRADQSYKYFLVHKETTAREVVMLALRQFGISEHSIEIQNMSCNNYSLCEVSVEHGNLVKQKRLPESAPNLADRIGVHSRYYLRNNMSQETLVPDDAAQEMVKETHFTFWSLDPMELAMQLTVNDYKVFQDIEPTEYIDNLIGRESAYGTNQLNMFEQLVNREMFWVASVVCAETNIFRRIKCIKRFIKIAKYCKEFKNFNSMFAILSGLNTGTVSRLHNTWEKLPSKYQKIFDDLLFFLDPTRNMSKYRNLLNNASSTPPVIPIFPIVKKDLTFIELGNDTKVDGLVNFEKMRMIAKEVRHIVGLASSQYIPALMVPHGSSNPGSSSNFFSNLQAGNVSGVVTIRRKKRTSALIHHPRKMFEEAQMARRVRAYLANLVVIDDEEKLNEMSIQCEGKAKNEPAMMSPSLTANTLNGGPKFGVQGMNVNRMLALSEKSRTVNTKVPAQRGHRREKVTSPTLSHKASAGTSATQVRDSLPGALKPQQSLQGALKAVDLTAESSSVLGNLRRGGALRKISTSSNASRTSTSSQNSKCVGEVHGQRQSLDTDHDSGRYSMYDTQSQSSGSSSHQPSPATVSLLTPLGGHASPPTSTTKYTSRIHVPGNSGQLIKGASLPDYPLAAQMAYLSRQQTGGLGTSGHTAVAGLARHPSHPADEYSSGREGNAHTTDDIEEVISAV
ncbi:rap guanine nucleotide exchange factor 2-like isoform X2 [Watersipora subatra]|uniref:rap guanine nucleotide exchange factor 2-like isoform X2 n=1 Tax=Watersipora subatra TaxID=2589382 RepID=UPI00355C803E